MDDNETQDLTAGGPPPGSLSFVTPGIPAEWLAAEMAAAHAPVSGTHSHSHPTYGTQGSTERQRLGAIARELSARGVAPDMTLLTES